MRLTLSSSLIRARRFRIVKRKKISVPKALMFMYLASEPRPVSHDFTQGSESRQESSPAHRNELRSGQVLEGQIVFEQARDANDLFSSR